MRNAAYFIASQSEGSGDGFLLSTARSLLHAVKAWKSRRDVARLVDFDDRMLADIGLTRRDVRETLELPFASDLGRELQFRASRNVRRGWNI